MTYGAATYGGQTYAGSTPTDVDITRRGEVRTVKRVLEADTREIVRTITIPAREVSI